MRGMPTAFATVTVAVPPAVAVPLVETTTGFKTRYIHWIGAVAESPLSTFVTMIGPVTSAQELIAMPLEMPTIWVPETLMTCAAMPARNTVTGDVNPVPSMTNRVPPGKGPCVGVMAV